MLKKKIIKKEGGNKLAAPYESILLLLFTVPLLALSSNGNNIPAYIGLILIASLSLKKMGLARELEGE